MTAPRLPRLDDIRARLKAATPGPWERVDDGEIVHKGVAVASVMQDYDFPCLDPDDGSQTRAECEANVLLIQHAPEDIAFLLALVEKQDAEVAVKACIAALTDDDLDALADVFCGAYSNAVFGSRKSEGRRSALSMKLLRKLASWAALVEGREPE